MVLLSQNLPDAAFAGQSMKVETNKDLLRLWCDISEIWKDIVASCKHLGSIRIQGGRMSEKRHGILWMTVQ